MFWLHLKWLFWSINSIRPLFEALRRGQIFGQNYAWNHNLSADLFFFDIYMSLRAISLLKMPKHVTSSLQMTMSKNLSMDPQIFFLMVPKRTTDWRKKRLENAFFKVSEMCTSLLKWGCQSSESFYLFLTQWVWISIWFKCHFSKNVNTSMNFYTWLENSCFVWMVSTMKEKRCPLSFGKRGGTNKTKNRVDETVCQVTPRA